MQGYCRHALPFPSRTNGPHHADGACRAIADTPFPFPWAQMVLIMLMVYAMTVPLVVVGFVDSIWLGLFVNFFCVQSYWCLNEVARDLEDPFVFDPNDLPLARIQVSLHATMSFAAPDLSWVLSDPHFRPQIHGGCLRMSARSSE